MHPALVARRRRIAALRQRIVAATLATFVLAWGAVVWDGSMGETTTTAQATTTTTEQSTATDDATPTATDDADHDRRRLLDALHGAVVMGEHFFWITSRSAGIVALLASSAAVALGLMMSMRLRKGAGPAGHARGAVAGDHGRARRARARAARRRLPQAEPGRRHDPVRQRLRALVDVAGDHRRLAVRDPRPLVLLARPDRPAALAHAAPLHGAGVAARRRPLDRGGHGRRSARGSSWRPRRWSSPPAPCWRAGWLRRRAT